MKIENQLPHTSPSALLTIVTRRAPAALFGLALLCLMTSDAMSSTDFICKIRAEGKGGDYKSISIWEDAIRSDLRKSSSKVFKVSDLKTYDVKTDDGLTVKFKGGGTGLLKHINLTQQAYIIDCVGAAKGLVTLSNGHEFLVGDAGDQIGVAGVECYNDWPNGLLDTITLSGFKANAEHYIRIYTPTSERHSGVLKADGKYTGFTIVKGKKPGVRFKLQVPFMRVEGIAVDAGGLVYDGIVFQGKNSFCDSCLVARGMGGCDGYFAKSDSCVYLNCIAINVGTGFNSTVKLPAKFYNCTSVNNSRHGFELDKNNVAILKNCIATGNPKDYFDADMDTVNRFESCISSDGSAAAWWDGLTKATSGTSTGAGKKVLIDATAKFKSGASRILAGMRIKNVTDGSWANVVSVDSETKITLDADVFSTKTKRYEIGKAFVHVTPIFRNSKAGDFHLGDTDTVAKDKGTNLSGTQTPFHNDIDGGTRSKLWDIGADEHGVGASKK